MESNAPLRKRKRLSDSDDFELHETYHLPTNVVNRFSQFITKTFLFGFSVGISVGIGISVIVYKNY